MRASFEKGEGFRILARQRPKQARVFHAFHAGRLEKVADTAPQCRRGVLRGGGKKILHRADLPEEAEIHTLRSSRRIGAASYD